MIQSKSVENVGASPLLSRAMDLMASQTKSDRTGLMNYFQSISEMWIEISMVQVQWASLAAGLVKEWRWQRKAPEFHFLQNPQPIPTSSESLVAPSNCPELQGFPGQECMCHSGSHRSSPQKRCASGAGKRIVFS